MIQTFETTEGFWKNINHDLFSTSAESVPTDQKPAQTLFPPNPPLPISKPTVPKPPTNIQGSMLPGATKQSQVYEDVLFIGQSTPENDIPEKGADLFKATDIQGLEMNVSEDYNQAEWMSSQMDLRRVKTPEHAEKLEGVKEEEEGVSLPIRSFTEIADKVHQGLRVFYKVFTEQAEVLYLHVLRLYAIGDDLSNFHRRAKIANITGGTTSAVGGAAVITGLALAPVTLGASLIVSAVGLGVAAAGGITAASATLSDNVHEMSDRKKIEVVLQDYETRLVELRRCLHFVAEGVRRMRLHPLLRRNNYYAGDWEVRRALQTISLVGDPVEQAEEIVQKSTMALNSVYKGMDNYFSKDSKELKKGCKKEVTMQVNMLAKLLHENLVVLNSTREHLMEATGFV
ncbi:hypothetical protein C0J45_22421 [Silurus meridionalis]|nr:hypothetical protein C0J45_22421 [Silurus meridionalis]